ncbi:MAG: hypothetical protein M1820_010352 [Bogoriella megaspora]|nr:MAG: hypothetical protein M1820_010352 [Bogoriella megaspora]
MESLRAIFEALWAPSQRPRTSFARPINRNEEEIRLIEIQPGGANEPLRCRLRYHPIKADYLTSEYRQWIASLGREFTLEDRLTWRKHRKELRQSICRYEWGDYFCLSYTWGIPEDLQEILLDGHLFKVRKNLATALRNFRDRPLPDGCLLWIDALSINQDDLRERGLEVERMRSIFAKAIDTILWLGFESQNIHEAFRFIENTAGIWHDTKLLEETLRKQLSETAPAVWLSLLKLSELSYWTRQWVLQELAMGTTKMPVYYGGEQTNWEPLWKIMWYFRDHRNDEWSDMISRLLQEFPAHLDEILKTVGSRHMLEFTSFHEKVIRADPKPSTTQLLTHTRYSGATDPRDKIYGLLGILPQDLSEQVRVDYGASFADVYLDFTQIWIQHDCSLEVLAHCDDGGSPSWVPRLQDHSPPRFRHLHSAIESPYCASLDRKAEFSFSNDRLSLHCEGVIVDTVDGLSSAVLSIDFRDENRLMPSRAHGMLQSNHTSNAYGGESGLREAIWRSSGGNRDLKGVVPAPTEYEALLTVQALENVSLNEWVEENKDFIVAGKPFKEYFSLQDTGNRQDREDAVERFTRCAWSRRLMTGVKGFIGFVAQQTQPGDVVAVIFGATFPLVLRPTSEGTYRVVTPCYIEGCMNGEIIEKLQTNPENTERQTITLI